jgi:ankyrin repeat protein
MAVAAGLHEVGARLRAELQPLTAIELLALEQYEAVRALLVTDGRLDLGEVARQRLLQIAAALGLSDALTFLMADLGVPADLPGPNYFGKGPDHTALAYATMSGHPSAVQALLQAGADANADLGGNMLAIHLAAMTGNAEITRLLAAHGGDLERRDDMNEATPLQWSKHNRRSDVARLLESLESGAQG